MCSTTDPRPMKIASCRVNEFITAILPVLPPTFGYLFFAPYQCPNSFLKISGSASLRPKKTEAMSPSPCSPCRPPAGVDLATPWAPDCHLPASGTTSTRHRRRGTKPRATAVRRGLSPRRGGGNALRQQEAGPSLAPEWCRRRRRNSPSAPPSASPLPMDKSARAGHHEIGRRFSELITGRRTTVWTASLGRSRSPRFLHRPSTMRFGGICLFGVASKRLYSDMPSARGYY